MMKMRPYILFPLVFLLLSCNGTNDKQTTTLSVREVAEQVSVAAQKYDDSIDSEKLLETITGLDSSIDVLEECTYSEFFLLLQSAFSSSLPEKTGARLMEGYNNPTDATFSTYGESSIYTSAFRMISDAGLINSTDFGADFDQSTTIDSDTVWTILDRFHNYYGASYVDDFYSVANYEQRITNCKDEGTAAEDSVYVANLIPRANINAWSREELVNDADSSAFYENYIEAYEEGDAVSELRDYLSPILASENIVSLVNELVGLHNAYGYSPLYESISWGFTSLSVGSQNQSLFLPTSSVFLCEDLIEEAKEGGVAYQSTLERFTPMFSSLLGSETSGSTMAKHYADFKYLNVLNYKNNSSISSDACVLPSNFEIGDTGEKLSSILGEIGYPSDQYWLLENERAATSFYTLFTDENIDAIKGYCLFETMSHYLVLLPEEESFNEWILGEGYEGSRLESDSYFFNYILPYYANDLVNYYSQTDEYKEDVAVVKGLYDDLRENLISKASSSSWLSSSGANKVSQKANKMKYFIGNTSDKSERTELVQIEYASLDTDRVMSHIGLYDSTLFSSNVAKVGTGMTQDFYYVVSSYFPFTANAFYLPSRNGICITMGYMTANERPSLMCPEELLSHYGWVVGHEIGHGFDTNGFKYNADGNYAAEWMNESDRNALSSFSEKFTNYMEGYEAIIGSPTSGSVVLNEAVADNIGLSLSLTIGQKNDNFSLQEFFLEGAMAFGGYITRSYYFNREYESDSHPFGRARVNRAFSCFDEFHETFKTKEGDHMYIESDERLVLY